MYLSNKSKLKATYFTPEYKCQSFDTISHPVSDTDEFDPFLWSVLNFNQHFYLLSAATSASLKPIEMGFRKKFKHFVSPQKIRHPHKQTPTKKAHTE